jgi:hypothetical protein
LKELDDSVRFLGKEIDPYTTQHKRDANFYREILLNSMNIKPQSREIEVPKTDTVKAKMFRPKSARELFNAKNFKTPKYLIKKPKIKLMKDIELGDFNGNA